MSASGGSPMPTKAEALRLAGSMALLVRALEQDLRAREGGDALTLTELGALGRIERGVDQPALLARDMRLDPGRVTHMTDRLAARGYLDRSVDPEDRRRWRLRLTEDGRRRLEDGWADVEMAMGTLLEGLSADERAALTRGLEAARRALDAAAGSGAARG